MKKFLFAALLMTASTAANAGTWEKLNSLGDRDVKTTDQYNVPAYGWDARAVEWTPKDNPDYRCIFIAGSRKAGAACYPAKKEQP